MHPLVGARHRLGRRLPPAGGAVHRDDNGRALVGRGAQLELLHARARGQRVRRRALVRVDDEQPQPARGAAAVQLGPDGGEVEV